MIYPNVFVSEDFLENFDEIYTQLENVSIYDIENENRSSSLMRIRDLLLSSNIYTDLKTRKLIKFFNESKGDIKNIKELVFRRIIKERVHSNARELINEVTQDDCKKSNFCYFTNNSFNDCELQSKEEGKIILGRNFVNNSFFLKQTFPGEPTTPQIPQIEEKAKHPCSSLVIIDKYIFEDSNRYEPKIPNLIHFLNNIIPDKLSKPFEIDIITGNPQNNNIITNKYNEILSAFNERISLHIYAPMNFKNSAERYLITNYATLIIHHPFDRDTDISCSFFPSNNDKEMIKTSFLTWINKLTQANQIINGTREKIGNIQCIWKSDEEHHSIFDLDE